MDIETLVATLQKANWAYHNTDTPSMTDDEYDRGLEELRRRSPAHPFLRLVGAPVEANAKGVILPYTMASLDKVRFGEEGLQRWLRRWQADELVMITEKLDGLSALLTTDPTGKQQLYLRGDGVKGVDVSAACKSLKVPKVSCVVRGEILLPNDATPEGSIGRSLVNGWLHRMAIEELKRCHFVAYQVIEPAGLTRQEQLVWLKKHGFRIPAVSAVLVKAMNNDCAKELLLHKKQTSAYPLDGIVVGIDRIPLASSGGEATNPDDAVAFKAALDEQKAQTTIVGVEWNLSRQNFYIPRIQIQPVVIGGARIEWLSGHNAAFVEEHGLGPGAMIVIRRSGDVIPTLDSVMQRVQPMLPADCSWDDTHTHVKPNAASDGTVGEKALLHALQTLEVDSIGPGLVKKLVEANITTMQELYATTPDALGAAIGAGRGPTLHTALRNAVSKATQMQLLIASNLLPRGVGEKKLRSLYAIEGNAQSWSAAGLGKPTGWTEESIATLLASLPKVFAWMETSFGSSVSKEAPSVASASASASASEGVPKRSLCFTGCRLKVLPPGWEEVDSVTKACQLLVIADNAVGKETTKTKKATALGIPIQTLSEFQAGH